MKPEKIRSLLLIAGSVLAGIATLDAVGEWGKFLSLLAGALMALPIKAPGDKRPAKVGIGMDSYAPAILFCLLALPQSSACIPGTHKVDWPRVLNCGPVVADIVATVTRILLASSSDPAQLDPSGKRELQRLAEQEGASAVACAIRAAVDDWRRPGAALSGETIGAAMRGDAFLAEQGVQ